MTKREQAGREIEEGGRSTPAKLRRTGMFIDLAAFILSWRMDHADHRYPPEAEMRDHLKSKGWRTKPSRIKPEGGEITTRTIQEMMLAMTDGENVFPPAALDRIASNAAEALPGTEIATVAISPDDWIAFSEEVRDGWKPTWRAHTIRDEESGGGLP